MLQLLAALLPNLVSLSFYISIEICLMSIIAVAAVHCDRQHTASNFIFSCLHYDNLG